MTRLPSPCRLPPFAAGIIVLIALPLLLFLKDARGRESGGPWQGVDEAVVEQIAKEHHREARLPLLGTGGGDLGLFAFLLAGACGGFAAGYYWRKLVDSRTRAGSDGGGSRAGARKGI